MSIGAQKELFKAKKVLKAKNHAMNIERKIYVSARTKE